MIVRDFQAVIGRETRAAVPGASSAGCPTRSSPASAAAATRPACSTRSSTTPRSSWSASRRAAAARQTGEHAASLRMGKPGVLHGSFSYVLQDDDGQTPDVHSISAGLDYPGVGPEHSYWKDMRPRPLREHHRRRGARRLPHPGRRLEGILPALESSHAVAQALKEAPRLGPGKVLVVCLSGRGDKDAYEVARLRGEPMG